mmetsp:Transcript_81745/g.243771  ORF Transcript_81745/g.243771 Transcript_81745/m.243771 type:complete len:303 (-) Transcript_81745:486-1394(-)
MPQIRPKRRSRRSCNSFDTSCGSSTAAKGPSARLLRLQTLFCFTRLLLSLLPPWPPSLSCSSPDTGGGSCPATAGPSACPPWSWAPPLLCLVRFLLCLLPPRPSSSRPVISESALWRALFSTLRRSKGGLCCEWLPIRLRFMHLLVLPALLLQGVNDRASEQRSCLPCLASRTAPLHGERRMTDRPCERALCEPAARSTRPRRALSLSCRNRSAWGEGGRALGRWSRPPSRDPRAAPRLAEREADRRQSGRTTGESTARSPRPRRTSSNCCRARRESRNGRCTLLPAEQLNCEQASRRGQAP